MDTNLLANFSATNKTLLPVLSKVLKVDRSPDWKGGDDDDGGAVCILYNTLTHHRIRQASLLVLHAWTSHIKIVAATNEFVLSPQHRQHQQQHPQQQPSVRVRYFAIPLTYQGEFKVIATRLNGVSELIEWSLLINKYQNRTHNNNHLNNMHINIHNNNTHNPHNNHCMCRVRVAKVNGLMDKHILKEGDVVCYVPHTSSTGNVEPTLDEGGDVYLLKEDEDNLLQVRVPQSLEAEFVEITNDSNKSLTISELAEVVRRRCVAVEVVRRGTDHGSPQEDLPSRVLLVRLASEASLLASEHEVLQPAFHLPTRLPIYLKLLKQLPAASSPLLNKKLLPKLSMLDRCVEHLDENTFQSIMSVEQPTLSIGAHINRTETCAAGLRGNNALKTQTRSIAGSGVSKQSRFSLYRWFSRKKNLSNLSFNHNENKHKSSLNRSTKIVNNQSLNANTDNHIENHIENHIGNHIGNHIENWRGSKEENNVGQSGVCNDSVNHPRVLHPPSNHIPPTSNHIPPSSNHISSSFNHIPPSSNHIHPASKNDKSTHSRGNGEAKERTSAKELKVTVINVTNSLESKEGLQSSVNPPIIKERTYHEPNLHSSTPHVFPQNGNFKAKQGRPVKCAPVHKTSIGESFQNGISDHRNVTPLQNRLSSCMDVSGRVGFDLDLSRYVSETGARQKPREGGISSRCSKRSDLSDKVVISLPKDGDLSEFNVKMFSHFLRGLHLDDEVVRLCWRLEVDGRKFGRLSAGEATSLGLDQPVLQYFRRRTRRETTFPDNH